MKSTSGLHVYASEVYWRMSIMAAVHIFAPGQPDEHAAPAPAKSERKMSMDMVAQELCDTAELLSEKPREILIAILARGLLLEGR